MTRFLLFLTLLPFLLITISLQGAQPVPVPTEDDVEQNSGVNEIRRGLPTGPTDGKSREQVFYENLIQKVEPGMKGDRQRLSVYIALFERELINDTRLFATDVAAVADKDGTIRLSGYVMFDENKTALLKLFEYLGFEDVESESLEVLPSKNLGEKQYAFVSAPSVFSYSAANDPSERVTQAFLGDPIFLLREAENGRLLATTAEGYIGYIPGDSLLRVTAKEFGEYQGGARAHLLRDFRTEDMFIPAGVRLKLGGQSDGGTVTAELPGGRSISLPEEIVEVRQDGPSERTLQAIEVAKSKLGTRYVWGGKTSEGVDCSGLTQSSFKAQGINIPRDAYMQAYMGNLVATRWYRDGLQMGDLVFFLGGNGKISHVGIYIKDGVYLEASGSVKFTSIREGAENYDERRDRTFCFAKRLLE